MNQLKRGAIIVGTAALTGIMADIVTYSIMQSKGKKFAFHMPKGKDLTGFIVSSIIVGVLINTVQNAMQNSLLNKIKDPEEKKLDALVSEEEKKISEGLVKGKTPEKVIWA